MNILVTGGAGYIGSHCCKALAAGGHRPIVFDSLVKGHRENVRWGEFVRGDINDPEALERCLERCRVDAVVHFAAFIEVGESVADPLAYYANNVGGTLQLLRAVQRRGVRNFVFSSSAAVYGTPERVPIEEDHPLNPVSPYGWTKRMMEAMLETSGGPTACAGRPCGTSTRRVRTGPRTSGRRTTRRATSSRGCSMRPSRDGRSTFSARTTPPRTGPASATMSMCPTWPRPMSRPSSAWRRGVRQRPSTSARDAGTPSWR